MTRSSFTRGATIALGALLALTGLTLPAQATTDAPVVLIVLENHSYGATDPGVKGDTTKYVVGNTLDAPYINGTLIPSSTLFTNFDAMYHPSLPDYLELSAGTNGGCTVDQCLRDSLPNENLFHLLGQAGTSFASLSESMPAPCTLKNVGLYMVRHNPQAYFTDVDAASGLPYACPATNLGIAPAAVPGTALSWPNPLPAFTYVSPNACNDMHGSAITGPCPSGTDQIVAAGDAWLSVNVPALVAQGAIVIITFDEGSYGDPTGGGGHVATIMTGPGVPAGTDARFYNLASLLGGLQDYFDLAPLLGHAATLAPLPIPRATPYPTPVVSGLSPDTGAPGDQLTIGGSGLTNAYAVRFGNASATFTVTSDSSITATVPVGGASGPVAVSTIGGTATSPGSFTVLPGGPPLPALVQHAASGGVKGTVATAAWPATPVAGDLQVATLGWSGSAIVTPPTGWALAVSSGSTAIYYRESGPADPGPVTFSLSAASNWVLSIAEWSGIAASGSLDRTAHATGAQTSGTTAASGTTAVTSQPVELVVAGIRALSSVTQSGPTNGATQVDQRSAGTNDTLGVYGIVSVATGAQSVAVTLSAPAQWRGVIATFRSA